MDKSSEDLGSGSDLTLDRPCLWPEPQLSFWCKDVKRQRFVVRAVGGRGPQVVMEMVLKETVRPLAPTPRLLTRVWLCPQNGPGSLWASGWVMVLTSFLLPSLTSLSAECHQAPSMEGGMFLASFVRLAQQAEPHRGDAPKAF